MLEIHFSTNDTIGFTTRTAQPVVKRAANRDTEKSAGRESGGRYGRPGKALAIRGPMWHTIVRLATNHLSVFGAVNGCGRSGRRQ